MSGGEVLERGPLEAEEREKTEEVARLAKTVEALETRLGEVRRELTAAVGGLTTLRRILGIPIGGRAPGEPVGSPHEGPHPDHGKGLGAHDLRRDRDHDRADSG